MRCRWHSRATFLFGFFVNRFGGSSGLKCFPSNQSFPATTGDANIVTCGELDCGNTSSLAPRINVDVQLIRRGRSRWVRTSTPRCHLPSQAHRGPAVRFCITHQVKSLQPLGCGQQAWRHAAPSIILARECLEVFPPKQLPPQPGQPSVETVSAGQVKVEMIRFLLTT